jgi:photosystem II stability/assembly factor-like uncharacterized protein
MSLFLGGGLIQNGLFKGARSTNGTMFVFGNNGEILSIDNNFIPTTITSPTTNNYIDAWFSSDMVGYAVTSAGEVIKTTNGGDIWNLVSTIVNPFDIRAIYAIDDNTVVVGGKSAVTGSMIWRSVDGGVSWNSVWAIPDTQPIESFSFVDSLTGFCVDINRLIMTVNGGATWAQIASNPPLYSDEISMANAFVGWIGRESGVNSAYKTTGAGSGITSFNTSGDTLGVHAIDTNRAFMCGTGGYVYKTTDGTNWPATRVSSTGDTLTCIHFSPINQAKGIVCGALSSVYVTTNSGTTWTQISGLTGGYSSAFVKNP